MQCQWNALMPNYGFTDFFIPTLFKNTILSLFPTQKSMKIIQLSNSKQRLDILIPLIQIKMFLEIFLILYIFIEY